MNVTDNCRTDLPQKTQAPTGMPPLRVLASQLQPSRPVKAEEMGALYRAADKGLTLFSEVLDTVANKLAHSELSEHDTVAVARTAGLMAVHTYVVELQAAAAKSQATALRDGLADIAAAIRETAPELAGAVSEAGTDIGAGLLAALSTLAPGGEPATA